jgi:hypothetical protein
MSEYISEAVESVVSEVESAPVEPVEEAVEPVEEEAVEPASANEVETEEAVEELPVEQVASDIREILAPTASADEVSSNSEGLTDDLKQHIAELDYLRECCGNKVVDWDINRRTAKINFLTSWENKNVSIDPSVNYEDTLNQLEKMPEIIKLWVEGKVTTDSNHFKNIESYTLGKPLFNDKNVTEKIEVVEQLVTLLTDCVNGKMRTQQVKEVIDNLY